MNLRFKSRLIRELHGLLQRFRQGRQFAALEEEAAEVRDLAENVVAVHGAFQIGLSGASAGADT